MKYRLKLIALIACTIPSLALGAVQDLKTNNDGAGITSSPSASSLGSKMKIDNNFNANSVQTAFDTSSTKDNIKTVNYSPKEIIKVRLRLNMNTLIVLPKLEKIKAFTLADDYSYVASLISYEEMPNMISLKGKIAGTDTDFKIIGESGNIYNFYLRTDPVESKFMPDLTIYIDDFSKNHFQFSNELDSMINDATKKMNGLPTSKNNNREKALDNPPYPLANILDLQTEKADYLKTLPDPTKANINYKMSGDYEIAPTGVYDDNQWTYFDFRGKSPSDRLPVISKVIDGHDTLVNTRMEKGFLIAESISKEGWTLQNGDLIVCVRKTGEKSHGRR